jgi:hypothetical protein
MWFRTSEHNTLRPEGEVCIAVSMVLFKAELNSSRFNVYPVLLYLKTGQLH